VTTDTFLLSDTHHDERTACQIKSILIHLMHLAAFLVEQGLDWRALTPARAVDLLIHLRNKRSRGRGPGHRPSLATIDGERAIAPPDLLATFLAAFAIDPPIYASTRMLLSHGNAAFSSILGFPPLICSKVCQFP